MLFIHDESATKQTALRRRNPKGGKGLRVSVKLQGSKFIAASVNGLIGGLRQANPYRAARGTFTTGC